MAEITKTQKLVLNDMKRGWTLLYNIAECAYLLRNGKFKGVRVATAQKLCELGLVDRLPGKRLQYVLANQSKKGEASR